MQSEGDGETFTGSPPSPRVGNEKNMQPPPPTPSVDQRVVDSPLCHQFVVGASLGDAALLQDDDQVCLSDGRQPLDVR